MTPVVVVVVGGAVVWFAGTRLSRDADVIAEVTGIGRVLVGALMLGLVTSLPEVATTVTAGVVGNPELAIGNLVGGVALQVVVLAVADLVESEQRLTFQVSKPGVLVQHVVLLLLLGLVVAGMAVGEPVTVAGVGFWPVLITVVYGGTLLAVRRAEGDQAWAVADGGPRLGRGSKDGGGEDGPDERSAASAPPAWRVGGLVLLVLASGWAVARAGDTLAESEALSGTFVGAGLVALTTSLPELSTVLGSLRRGAYDMAVSNIVGTNGIELALLLVADIAFREGPVLAHATDADLFLVALSAVLTSLYLGGILLRREDTVLRIGPDSLSVLVVYALGMVVLAVTG